MNWFKRLCMFLFGLSGILSLVALSLVWVGPWTTQARSLLLENKYYFLVLEILVCVSAVGLLVCMLVALFAPRNPRETVVAQVDGGDITVTRAAIVSQTRHIIEADGTCNAASVHVRVRKRGNVRVSVRVQPHLPVDVVKHGEALYSELEQGLAMVCGDSVKSIDIVFTEPEQQGTLSTYVETSDSAGGTSASSEQDIRVRIASHATAKPEPEPQVAAEPEPQPEPQVAPEPEPQVEQITFESEQPVIDFAASDETDEESSQPTISLDESASTDEDPTEDLQVASDSTEEV